MTDSEKLDVIISTLNEHTAILNEHTAILNEHSAILNEHTAILNEHSAMLKKHDEEISSMKFLLENEMRVNIQRVAEGYLDLSRNLHEAMRPSNELEMLSIKVRQLESDMREVKQKIS